MGVGSFTLGLSRGGGGRGGLHFVPPREHLVLVAGDLEAFPGALHAHNRHVRQTNLIGRGEDRHCASFREAQTVRPQVVQRSLRIYSVDKRLKFNTILHVFALLVGVVHFRVSFLSQTVASHTVHVGVSIYVRGNLVFPVYYTVFKRGVRTQ